MNTILSPENLGWLALYACILKRNLSADEALKRVGVKIPHKERSVKSND